MEVKQCEFCRMPFQSLGNRVCGECLKMLDEEFIKIREYLYEHDRAGIEEVSEETGVSRKTILYLLKEERLIVGDENGDGGGILKCESCKKSISTGRMCLDCKKEIFSAMQESVGAVVRRPKRIKEETDIEARDGIAKLQVKGRKGY